ncbi:MAG: alpha/beta hydrolase [Acidobacteriota bacterium]
MALSERLEHFRRAHPVQRAKHADVEWRYRVAGAGATGLILLPGSAGGGDAYFRLVERLEADFRCLMIDYPVVDGIEAMLAGLAAVLAIEEIDRFSVVGGSFGGMIAQALLLEDPSRVERVVLNSTGPPSPARATSNQRWQPVMRCLPISWIRGLLSLVVRKIAKKIDVEKDFWIEYYTQAARAITRADLESKYRVSIDFDRSFGSRLDSLAGWQGAILLTQGSADSLAGEKMRSELLRAYPRAQVKTFEGAGHGVSLERPDEWEDTVVQFLRGEAASFSAR